MAMWFLALLFSAASGLYSKDDGDSLKTVWDDDDFETTVMTGAQLKANEAAGGKELEDLLNAVEAASSVSGQFFTRDEQAALLREALAIAWVRDTKTREMVGAQTLGFSLGDRESCKVAHNMFQITLRPWDSRIIWQTQSALNPYVEATHANVFLSTTVFQNYMKLKRQFHSFDPDKLRVLGAQQVRGATRALVILELGGPTLGGRTLGGENPLNDAMAEKCLDVIESFYGSKYPIVPITEEMIREVLKGEASVGFQHYLKEQCGKETDPSETDCSEETITKKIEALLMPTQQWLDEGDSASAGGSSR